MKTLLLIIITYAIGSNRLLGQSNSVLWETINESSIELSGKRDIIPQNYKTYHLNFGELIRFLNKLPSNQSVSSPNNFVLNLPMPDGLIKRFAITESPVMDELLQKSFPQIKTYNVKGLDDVYANGKVDITEFGFHGMIRNASGVVFIDPYCQNNTNDYISYYKKDFQKPDGTNFMEFEFETNSLKDSKKISSATPLCSGSQLRTYRLAVACTPEYAIAATGMPSPSVSDVLAKVVTTINRVDGIYESEVAIKLVLVSTTTLVLYTSAGSSSFTPFENNNSFSLIAKSQTVIDAQIGNSNYDIGHTFSTGSGGLADLGIVCNNSRKALGVTGSPMPVGDPFDIDFVAHEMGHQFGANHTFNSATGSCAGNRFAATSVEPGSGVTLMGYAGLCGSTNNLESHSITYFHTTNYDEIMNFVTTGIGNTCPVITTTGNNPPTVTANADIAISKNTPFVLTGSAIDPEGDPLTYQWEEVDPGRIAGNWDLGEAPFFRSYDPITTSSRSFPNAAVIASGNFQGTKGEYLPNTDQVLHFRLVVRDNKTGGGGVCYAATQVTVGTPTGIEKYTNANGLDIAIGPNPFSDFITLTIKNDNSINLKNFTVTIYDVIGNMVKQESNLDVNYFSKPYDLSYLSKGSYYIEVTDGTKKSVVPLIKL